MTMLRTGGWILFMGLTAPSAAQDPGHFGQLIEAIEPGDDIRVTLSGGRVSRAQVVGVTLETLSVRVGDHQLDLGRNDVWAVRYSVDDPTDDGFRRGFATGAASFALLTIEFCRAEGCAPNYGGLLLMGGLFGMVGGWIGVGVDHLTQSEKGWPTTTRRAWGVAPLLAPDRRGLAVSLSF